MFNIIAIILLIILSAALVVCIGIIRGALKIEKSSDKIRPLTGKEIEVMRRKLATVGLQAISKTEVFCLIKTIRDTNLGIWKDPDPYFPADPYEDIDRQV